MHKTCRIMVDKWKTFQKVFHMTKIRKSANNQVIHKIIHIIHKDNNVDDLIYICLLYTSDAADEL